MKKSHNITGIFGEDQAVAHLRKKGYEILERNWRYGHLEIDIIAKKQNILKIIEVKTRTSSYFGSPESFVGERKIQHLIRATNAYIEQKNLDCEVCFDIIGIEKHKNILNHIENAFKAL